MNERLPVKKILVAVDGSPQSMRAIKLASRMARDMDAGITLIHVQELHGLPTLIAEAEDEAASERGQMVLGAAAKVVRLDGLTPKAILRKGHAADQILRYIVANKPDVVVMGRRGLSRVKSILMGSTSQAIAQHAKCAVLIVN